MLMPIKVVDGLTDERGHVLLQDPPVVRMLFSHAAAAWLWLGVRLWLGYQWLTAASHKLTDPAWMDGSGAAIRTYWTSALGTTPAGQPVITYDWYRAFLQMLVDNHAETWFSKLIVGGELTVGLAVLLGAGVAIAAGGGLAMNFAYMLAGSASSNPILALLEIGLILAWKNAVLRARLLPAAQVWTALAGGGYCRSRLITRRLSGRLSTQAGPSDWQNR